MNAFRCLRLVVRPAISATTPSALLRPSIRRIIPSQRLPLLSSTRSISLLSARRPILPTSSFAPNPPLSSPSSTSNVIISPEAIDILPKISSHPVLSGIQVRCGPRDTYNPSHLVRKRRHGFLSRLRTKKGRKMLMRRIKKGRWNLSH